MADSNQTAAPSGDDLVVLATQPLVAETRLADQRGPFTPNRNFFIRDHYSVPRLDAAAWRLSIGGTVESPRTLTLDDVRGLPGRELAATMECAGNARSYLPQPWEGNPFDYGAASTAAWRGVALAAVLGPAGVRPGTREILFRGADRGFEKNVGKEISFERSLPLDVAMHPDTMLVYEMNGEPLPVDHGFPLRLVVPGWYGVASVKWLTAIEALAEPFQGYFQVQRYVLPNGANPPTPLGERRVRSVITHPAPGATLRAGRAEVRGLAWSGNQPVARVELSTDGGQSWRPADLAKPISPYAWQDWHASWDATPGEHTLQSRAMDLAGHTQPERAEWNLLGYANNGIQSVKATVS